MMAREITFKTKFLLMKHFAEQCSFISNVGNGFETCIENHIVALFKTDVEAKRKLFYFFFLAIESILKIVTLDENPALDAIKSTLNIRPLH